MQPQAKFNLYLPVASNVKPLPAGVGLFVEHEREQVAASEVPLADPVEKSPRSLHDAVLLLSQLVDVLPLGGADDAGVAIPVLVLAQRDDGLDDGQPLAQFFKACKFPLLFRMFAQIWRAPSITILMTRILSASGMNLLVRSRISGASVADNKDAWMLGGIVLKMS